MQEIKRGDTLIIFVKRSANDNTPLTGDAAHLKAQIRTTSDKLLAEFVITETPEPGTYQLLVPANITADFPIAKVLWDLQFDDGINPVKTTPTQELYVIKDVTHP